MSKLSAKSRGPKRGHLSAPGKKQVNTDVILILLVTILAGIPFCLGKYFEFNSPDAFDSGSNVYSAKRILDGARIDVDEKPSAATGTLLVNMLGVRFFGFNETGPKLLQGIFQLAALVLMFVSMRRIFGSLAATVGVAVTSIYTSAPLIAKFGNVKDQFMIACMVMGISCFVMRQLTGKAGWAILAGLLIAWAPLFKETGLSAMGAVALFLLAGPLIKNRSWKDTFADIIFMLVGAVIGFLPVYIWLWLEDASLQRWPYITILKVIFPFGGQRVATYISGGYKTIKLSELAPRVFRYYALLILPISLALVSTAVAVVRWILGRTGKFGIKPKDYERFVLLFAVWWILDMAFVWASPYSYEQYYLPLNASAAMLGGYIVALCRGKFSAAVYKSKWIAVGIGALLVMVVMSWHIFFGIEKSPHSGMFYGRKARGYLQKYQEISLRRRGGLGAAWEAVGDYIRAHSTADDKIYVWGWFPGIYVQAQRFSSASRAVLMPRPAPQELAKSISTLLTEFHKEMPKFIVDSRKRDVPMERPPYELWPLLPKGFMGRKEPTFLPLNQEIIKEYDEQWAQMLRKRFDNDEAERYEVLKPLREFVMNNYRVVSMFGDHVLFELKTTAGDSS